MQFRIDEFLNFKDIPWSVFYHNMYFSSVSNIYSLSLRITTHQGATKEEMGKYYAVLYLNKKFYFSSPIFLNVTGQTIFRLPKLNILGIPFDITKRMTWIVEALIFWFS